MAIEKGQVGLDWLKVQSTEVIRLADEYEVSKYLEHGFEACGRSMIWLGDMMAEVAGMRTCCLKVILLPGPGIKQSSSEIIPSFERNQTKLFVERKNL